MASWVPGEDLPFSCYTDLIPVERTLRIAQLLFCCPAVCRGAQPRHPGPGPPSLLLLEVLLGL